MGRQKHYQPQEVQHEVESMDGVGLEADWHECEPGFLLRNLVDSFLIRAT